MRLVLDTNVVVAGLVSEGLCHELVEAHLPDHTAILSRILWDELVEKRRDRVRPRRGGPAAAGTLSTACRLGRAAPPGEAGLPRPRRRLGPEFEGVAILSPRQILEPLARAR